MLFGEYLRNKRTSLGLSQTEIAASLGLWKQTISKWENNIALPDIKIIPKVAEILRINPIEIMDVIWDEKSIFGVYKISVNEKFDTLNILKYYFKDIEKIGNGIYKIRCSNHTLENFLEKYGKESNIKILLPKRLRQDIILNLMPTYDNYTLNERFNSVIEFSCVRADLLGRSIKKKKTIANLLHLSSEVCQLLLDKLHFEDFEDTYYNSKNQDEFDKNHQRLCNLVLDIRNEVLTDTMVSKVVEIVPEKDYAYAQHIVNNIFNLMIKGNLLDKKDRNLQFLHTKLPVYFAMVDENGNPRYDLSTYDKYYAYQEDSKKYADKEELTRYEYYAERNIFYKFKIEKDDANRKISN